MNRKPKKAAATAVLLLLLLMPSSAFALSKAEADSNYVHENYQKAIEQYETLIKHMGPQVVLNYNLGNAYYRMDDMTHAILNYERALLLAPGDADIRFNLQLARSKTVDKIVPQSELFVVTWYRSVVNLLGVDGWTEMAVVCLGSAILLFLVYLFCSPVWLRKVGFFGSALLMVAFVLANIFAWQQKQILERHDGAIIMDAAVPVKSTPSQSGTDLFILHEGTKVKVLDNSIGDWCEVAVPDGKQGWVETSQIEII